jgi:co-chaperonin GroES (HSP10)
VLVVTVAPLGDAVIVLRHGGSKATAFGIHVATAVVMLADAALLLASGHFG